MQSPRSRLSNGRSSTGSTFAVLAALVLALSAGCGNPGDVDGVLTDDWSAIGAPAGFVPVAGTCHQAVFAEVGTRAAYETVDCDTAHRTETVSVGTYPPAAAGSPAPPVRGSAGAVAAYRQCDTDTTKYVGAPWRTGRLWIGVVQPSRQAWSGGARWFRCEVAEVSSVEDEGDVVQRTGSLRDALTSSASPLRLTCYAIKVDSKGAISSMPPAGCVTPHNGEFVGVWQAGKLPYPEAGGDWTKFHDGCRRLIAAYVKVPVDANLEFRTGVVSLPGSPDVWAAGDRSVRCYLWLDSAKLTASLKGKGPKALPIQYE